MVRFREKKSLDKKWQALNFLEETYIGKQFRKFSTRTDSDGSIDLSVDQTVIINLLVILLNDIWIVWIEYANAGIKDCLHGSDKLSDFSCLNKSSQACLFAFSHPFTF